MVVMMIRTISISVAVAVAVMLMRFLSRTVSSVVPVAVSGTHSLGSATVAGARAGTAPPLAAVAGTNAFGPVASFAGAIHTASRRTAGALTVTAVVMVRS